MGFPEYCYQGGTLYITGRVLDPVSVVGWKPYLKIQNGVSIDPVLGSWTDVNLRTFYFSVSKELTEVLPLGTVRYEVYDEVPSGDVFVIEQGSFEVCARV